MYVCKEQAEEPSSTTPKSLSFSHRIITVFSSLIVNHLLNQLHAMIILLHYNLSEAIYVKDTSTKKCKHDY